MSIWKYSDAVEPDQLDVCDPTECRFCGTCLCVLDIDDYWLEPEPSYVELHYKSMFEGDRSFVEDHDLYDQPDVWQVVDGSPCEVFVDVSICPACGWWSIGKQATLDSPAQIWDLFFRAEGALCSLDLSDIDVQIQEIRSFLMATYESRFDIHPRRFEEVVGSVFGDLGYDVAVTAYSRDGGIDIVLCNQSGERIGVQVKRYRHSIKVEQIRSFAGALILGGFVRGIFVTTSDYQSGTHVVSQQAAKMGVPIELFDAVAFYRALGIAQLNGRDPALDVFQMLTRASRPKLHFVTEFCRNSL